MVKLSQCMIVKDEEKNIEQALAWAKPIAYEQIVVDTGSTDKTVEIAEKMGAKIYHFKWIKDFAAAKNYAIEQATGNWIAFLDADEYFIPEDAAELIKILEKAEKVSKQGKIVGSIKTPWVHFDDKDEVMYISEQTRLFRNVKELRYVGKIHEHITTYGKEIYNGDIKIMHTGYADSVQKDKGKYERNVDILRTELKADPNSITLKMYLVDSLHAKAASENYSNEKELAEVEKLYREVLESKKGVGDFFKKKAYFYFMRKTGEDPGKRKECLKVCEEAYNAFPNDLDICYNYAGLLNEMKELRKHWKY